MFEVDDVVLVLAEHIREDGKEFGVVLGYNPDDTLRVSLGGETRNLHAQEILGVHRLTEPGRF